MTDYESGWKAGLIAGVVWGAITAVLLVSVLEAFQSVVMPSIQKSLQNQPNVPLNAGSLFQLSLAAAAVGSIIVGIVGGIILGLVFAAVSSSYLRNRSYLIRGLVFGLILWGIDIAFSGLGGLAYGLLYFITNLFFVLVASLVYGYLLGYFFSRFQKRKFSQRRKDPSFETSTVGFPPPPPQP